MARINHNRPYLQYIDNLKKVREAADSWYRHDSHHIGKENKKKQTFDFSEEEWKVCIGLLEATADYYEASSQLFKNLETFKNGKIDIKQFEGRLFVSIRRFILAFMNSIINNNPKSGVRKFWKLLEKQLPKDDLLLEMIQNELREMNNQLDKSFA